MSDREIFARQVREALTHLDDPVYLRSHALAGAILGPDQALAPPEYLRRALVDAFAELRPPAPGRTSASERGYRLLSLRYVEKRTIEEIATELMIGPRQTRRDQQSALDALTSILWARRQLDLGPRGDPSTGAQASQVAWLDTELLRVSSEPAHEPVDVMETLRGALATVTALADEEGVHCELTLDNEVALVSLNRSVLRQILITLLTDGIRLGRGTRIRVTVRGDDDRVTIGFHHVALRGIAGWRVADECEPRWQVSSRLVQLQGGALHHRSPRGGEWVVEVAFPTAPLVTMLVVDDNPDFIRLVRRYVAGAPYRVLEANIGEEALRLAEATVPALIVLDVMMASQDGWEILQQLKACAETRSIPVLICSVLAEPSLARSLGAADYLGKPFSRAELLEMLKRLNRPPA